MFFFLAKIYSGFFSGILVCRSLCVMNFYCDGAFGFTSRRPPPATCPAPAPPLPSASHHTVLRFIFGCCIFMICLLPCLICPLACRICLVALASSVNKHRSFLAIQKTSCCPLGRDLYPSVCVCVCVSVWMYVASVLCLAASPSVATYVLKAPHCLLLLSRRENSLVSGGSASECLKAQAVRSLKPIPDFVF